MNENYRLVIFDWDGTLVDSAAIIVAAIQGAAADLGLAVPAAERARYVIGLGLQDAIAHVAPGLDEAGCRRFSERYREHYFARDLELALFPGVREMLAELAAQGTWLAIATGKSRAGLARALEQTGVGEFFLATRCADEGFAKPHPEMLLHLLDQTGVAASAAVMIGDTTHDLDMASAARVAGVAVTWGAHPREALAARQPRASHDAVPELRAWLKERT